MNKSKRTMAILAILLIIAVGYIVVDKYAEAREQKYISIYQQGAQEGYEQAITQLVQQAVTCQQVPIRYQNQTINVIAVECIQQG